MTMDGPLGHGLPAYSLDNAPDIRKFTPEVDYWSLDLLACEPSQGKIQADQGVYKPLQAM